VRSFWRFFGLGILCSFPALAQGTDPYKDGALGGIPYIMRDDFGRTFPYVNVYRSDLYREYLQAKQRNESTQGKTYEWQLPASTLEGTREVARDLLLAWQRLEERTYQHVLHKLNYMFGVSELLCLAKKAVWGAFQNQMKLNPRLPEVSTSAIPSYFPEGYRPGLPERQAAASTAFRMDWYSYYYAQSFRVHPDDFCDRLGDGILPIALFIPGFKVVLGDAELFKSPGYPWPFIWDRDEFEHRARVAIEDAASNYLTDYIKDAAQVVSTPRPNPSNFNLGSLNGFFEGLARGDVAAGADPKIYIPTFWTAHEVGAGVVTTPVISPIPKADLLTNLQKTVDAVNQANLGEDKLNAAKWPYYLNAFNGLTKRLGLQMSLPSVGTGALEALKSLAGLQYRSNIVRGIWPLEEIKRWFPPTLPQIHEALGYSTYFQVFAKPELTILPDPGAEPKGDYAMNVFLHSIHLWNIAFIIDLSCGIPPCIYPDPLSIFPIPIAPYVIPYAGPRYYWDWVSIPDGYPIPRVKGEPKTPPLPLPGVRR